MSVTGCGPKTKKQSKTPLVSSAPPLLLLGKQGEESAILV